MSEASLLTAAPVLPDDLCAETAQGVRTDGAQRAGLELSSLTMGKPAGAFQYSRTHRRAPSAAMDPAPEPATTNGQNRLIKGGCVKPPR